LQLNDYYFAVYLKEKGYTPQSTLNYVELKEEYNKNNKNAQIWLEQNYPKTTRVKKIYMS
jgi:hypothetical protein